MKQFKKVVSTIKKDNKTLIITENAKSNFVKAAVKIITESEVTKR